jgi:hypothetical protein
MPASSLHSLRLGVINIVTTFGLLSPKVHLLINPYLRKYKKRLRVSIKPEILDYKSTELSEGSVWIAAKTLT